jgi:phage/plasmid primase-like uncharacterized protein/KaiC/GvpD/RAD55 family RecA-like ATPase
MANLHHIFGGSFTPPQAPYIEPVESQVRNAMASAGLEPPTEFHLDGKIHRFRSGTKGGAAGDKTGWYIIYLDGIAAGKFGCWRSGVESNFRANIGRELTAAEQMAHTRRMAEARVLRDAELVKKHEIASDTVETIWTNCTAAHPDHPYLKRKGIEVHGARVTGDGRLVVPLFDFEGSLSSLQYIDAEGGKLYHPGGATGGMSWQLGTTDEPGTIYMAEGFATAATIHQVTNRPVVIAYSASNLVPVLAALRVRLGALQDIVIVADNDKSGVGQRYAEQACAKHGARLVMPPELGDANDYVQVGGDLALLLEPVQTDWLIHADDFSSQPAPIKWLVRNWIQDQALIMVHGPSGGGKTFVVLDWMLHMAAGLPTWSEQKVKPAEIVYLAGEGHIGLKGRIAAWKYHHHVGKLNMWLSKEGCDLNTSTGYNKVVEAIQFLPIVPKVIVVDTLHRFLHGDENSAQDTKTMLDACANLMAKFSATLILVHHTGVSDEAQHRARGSSAWRGALDIEISIVPAKDGQPMQIVQRKSKDAELAEPLAAELISVEIPKWLDEDGQPVTSAVVQMTDKVVVQKSSKLDVHRQKWEKAWFASGAELLDGKPFLTRSALREKLKVDGLADQSIKNMLNPANDDKMIGFLQNAGVIKVDGAGWTMEDKKVAEILIFSRNETNK